MHFMRKIVESEPFSVNKRISIISGISAIVYNNEGDGT